MNPATTGNARPLPSFPRKREPNFKSHTLTGSSFKHPHKIIFHLRMPFMPKSLIALFENDGGTKYYLPNELKIKMQILI